MDNTWDIGTTLNWNSGSVMVSYADGDMALFDDTAVGNSSVFLVSMVAPPAVIVNNSVINYTIAGAGGIGGITPSIPASARQPTPPNRSDFAVFNPKTKKS